MKNIGLIIAREFKERVYKKSFIITTLLMPLLMVLLSVAPTLIMLFAKGDAKQITVIDQSGIVAPGLSSDEEVTFVASESGDLQTELKRSLVEEDFGVLYIGADIVTNPNDVQLYTNSSSSMMIRIYAISWPTTSASTASMCVWRTAATPCLPASKKTSPIS